MRLTWMLGDTGSVAAGRLNVLGAGWTHAQAPVTGAICALLGIESVDFDVEHSWSVRLVDADGRPVNGVPGTAGFTGFTGTVRVPRPPDWTPGAAGVVPMVLPFTGLRLDPGRYEWVCDVDGDTLDRLPFTVVGTPQLP